MGHGIPCIVMGHQRIIGREMMEVRRQIGIAMGLGMGVDKGKGSVDG